MGLFKGNRFFNQKCETHRANKNNSNDCNLCLNVGDKPIQMHCDSQKSLIIFVISDTGWFWESLVYKPSTRSENQVKKCNVTMSDQQASLEARLFKQHNLTETLVDKCLKAAYNLNAPVCLRMPNVPEAKYLQLFWADIMMGLGTAPFEKVSKECYSDYAYWNIGRLMKPLNTSSHCAQ